MPALAAHAGDRADSWRQNRSLSGSSPAGSTISNDRVSRYRPVRQSRLYTLNTIDGYLV